MPWVKCKPLFKPELIGICGHSYHGHPRGCHMFCRRPTCPPTLPPLSICLDNFYFIYTKFGLGEYVRKMARKHPEWSTYQARNVLYWQPEIRRQAQHQVDRFLAKHPGYKAMGPKEHLDSWGIDVGGSLATVGVKLRWGVDWGLHEYTYYVRFAGTPIEHASESRLAKLAKNYPAIYHARIGQCLNCNYRPCLRYMTSNPRLYVTKRLGNVTIKRFVEGRGWLVRCNNCGKRKLVGLHIPFCKGSICTCLSKNKPKSKDLGS